MKTTQLLFAVFCLGLSALAAAEVTVLTATNFDGELEGESYLVEFYAPWCGHCKQLAPVFEEASERVAGKMKFGKVDATEHSALKSKYEVSGFPTIKFFREGEVQEYTHPRTVEGFVNFVERMNGPSVHKLAKLNNVKTFVNKNDVSFIFAKPTNGFEGGNGLYDAFKHTAKALQSTQLFAETKDPAFAASFDGDKEAPFVVKMEMGEEPVFYSGSADNDELKKWVLDNQFRVVSEIDGSNFRPLSRSGRYLAIGVVNPGQAATGPFVEGVKRLARSGSPLSKDVRDKYHFCTLDGVRWADFIDQFNIKVEELPRMFVLDGINKSFWEDVEVDEIDELETFLAGVVAGDVPVQREGLMGLPSRLARRFMEYMPYSAIAAGLLVVAIVAGYMTGGGSDEEEHEHAE